MYWKIVLDKIKSFKNVREIWTLSDILRRTDNYNYRFDNDLYNDFVAEPEYIKITVKNTYNDIIKEYKILIEDKDFVERRISRMKRFGEYKK